MKRLNKKQRVELLDYLYFLMVHNHKKYIEVQQDLLEEDSREEFFKFFLGNF